MKTTIAFEVDGENLQSYTDQYLAALWHIGQANPAPFGDPDACRFAEHVGREIIRRFLAATGPELWHHQGRHVEAALKTYAAKPSTIDEQIRSEVQPGEFVTIPDLIQRLGLPFGVTSEGALRDALHRNGFTPQREPGGMRRRGFLAPPTPALDPDPSGCLLAPRQERDTPDGQPQTFLRAASCPAAPQQGSPQPVEQPAQTALHQSPGSSDHLSGSGGRSLTAQQGQEGSAT